MSEKNKLSLKRTRQSSSTKGEKRPRIAEEQISSSKATGVAASTSERPGVLKRVSFSDDMKQKKGNLLTLNTQFKELK